MRSVSVLPLHMAALPPVWVPRVQVSRVFSVQVLSGLALAQAKLVNVLVSLALLKKSVTARHGSVP